MSAMDVRRPATQRSGWSRRGVGIALAAIALIAAIVAGVVLARTGSPGIAVDRNTIVTDVAQRGNLTLSISAGGELAPENVRVVDAVEPGVVQDVLVKPGAVVRAGDPIARMQDPDAQAALVDADSAVRVAQAQLASAQAQLRASALTQKLNLENAQAESEVAATNYASTEALHRNGYIADTTYQIAKIKRGQLAHQVDISRSAIDVDAADQQARVAAAQASVDSARARLEARAAALDALSIRASEPGVVQTVSVDPGVRVDAGAQIATIADTRTLKAVLAVPETQARDVAIGTPVRVDTGNGVVTGRVERIAPTANSGSVSVDVAFDRSLPRGARPSLNVTATIETARIADAVSIRRPAGAADDSDVVLYRVAAGTSRAEPIRARLGRGSLDRVQVLSGVASGDTIIVSDTSAYDGKTALNLR